MQVTDEFVSLAIDAARKHARYVMGVACEIEPETMRAALAKIATGTSRNPQSIADDALYSMFPLDKKQPLQCLVGHERRRTTL